MLRTVLEARGLVAMVAAASVGAWGLHTYPVRTDDVFLALIELRNPSVFRLLAYGYATLWFSTPFFLASLAHVCRRDRRLPRRTVSAPSSPSAVSRNQRRVWHRAWCSARPTR